MSFEKLIKMITEEGNATVVYCPSCGNMNALSGDTEASRILMVCGKYCICGNKLSIYKVKDDANGEKDSFVMRRMYREMAEDRKLLKRESDAYVKFFDKISRGDVITTFDVDAEYEKELAMNGVIIYCPKCGNMSLAMKGDDMAFTRELLKKNNAETCICGTKYDLHPIKLGIVHEQIRMIGEYVDRDIENRKLFLNRDDEPPAIRTGSATYNALKAQIQ